MNRRIVKNVVVLAVLALGLAATTVWAAFETERFTAVLNGVDPNGNLTPVGATETTFVALENTSNGNVIGTARGNVLNQSHQLQVYVNNPNFGLIVGVDVNSSLYVVYAGGSATLVATGHEFIL